MFIREVTLRTREFKQRSRNLFKGAAVALAVASGCCLSVAHHDAGEIGGLFWVRQ